MALSTGYERTAWEDRFNRPRPEALRAGLAGTSSKLFNRLRRYLLELEGTSEDLAWHGDCWRWTIEYRTKSSEEPLAVLIPSPEDLQIAVPLEPDLARSLAGRRMKRAVRDGVDLAAEPFDTNWAVWSVQSEGLVDDVVDLIELKLRHQAKQVG